MPVLVLALPAFLARRERVVLMIVVFFLGLATLSQVLFRYLPMLIIVAGWW